MNKKLRFGYPKRSFLRLAVRPYTQFAIWRIQPFKR